MPEKFVIDNAVNARLKVAYHQFATLHHNMTADYAKSTEEDIILSIQFMREHLDTYRDVIGELEIQVRDSIWHREHPLPESDVEKDKYLPEFDDNVGFGESKTF